MSQYAVVIFPSGNLAMRAEKVVQDAGIEAKLIPAPRHLSYDCGISLRISLSEKEHVENILIERRVEYESIAELDP